MSDRFSLGPDEVHIWSTTLDRGTRGVLSNDEIERADRFVREPDRRRFVAARSWMRSVLAAYLDQEASLIRFLYGPVGKPELATGGLSFNLAHSGDAALLGISRSGPIGVDVEVMRRDVFDRAAAALVLSERELARVDGAADRDGAFLAIWVRKEAYVKASGTGLELSLSSVTLPEGRREIEGLVVEDLDLGGHLVGAVAIPANRRLGLVREHAVT